jgi:CheY-like chemotaxis protein
MQYCIRSHRRVDLTGSPITRPSPTRDEVAVSTAYFSIERLLRLKAPAVDAALTLLGSAAEQPLRAEGRGPVLARHALFSCMIARSLPIPLDLLGIRSVLLIDDEPSVLRSLARVLRQAAPDLDLRSAEGAKEGLAQVAAGKPEAVIVDAYMPEMNGVEVCSRIRATRSIPQPAVLAMTADPTPELAAAFTRAGAIAFLEKPVDAPSLFEVLSAHLLPNSAGDW